MDSARTRVLASCYSSHGAAERLGSLAVGRGVPGQAEFAHRCDPSYGWGRRFPPQTEFPLVFPRLALREPNGSEDFDPAVDLSITSIPRTVYWNKKDAESWDLCIVGAFILQSRHLGVVAYASQRCMRGWFPLSSATAYDGGSCRISLEPPCMSAVTDGDPQSPIWGWKEKVAIWITLSPLQLPYRFLPNRASRTTQLGPNLAPSVFPHRTRKEISGNTKTHGESDADGQTYPQTEPKPKSKRISFPNPLERPVQAPRKIIHIDCRCAPRPALVNAQRLANLDMDLSAVCWEQFPLLDQRDIPEETHAF